MNINNTDLNIRPEVEQDTAFVDRLYRSTREDLLQLGLAEALIDNLIRMQFHAQQTGYRMQFPNAEYSIVEKNGEAIGYLVIDKGMPPKIGIFAMVRFCKFKVIKHCIH